MKKMIQKNGFNIGIFSLCVCLYSISYGNFFLNQLVNFTPISDLDREKLAHLEKNNNLYETSLPLFRAFPTLQKKIPYMHLGNLETPIEKLQKISDETGNVQMYVKRDDLTGKKMASSRRLFGGNKVRKLEFLLADARLHGATSVMTYGCVGSNHCVATAAYAQLVGMRSILMLKPQPISHIVRRNLLLMHQYGGQMHLSLDSVQRHNDTVDVFKTEFLTYGHYPYFIPTGGSCPRGILGFVNAAFELKEQIDRGEMPEPNLIYLSAGSFGSVTGLLLGAKAAGLESKIIPVSVEPEEREGICKQTILELFNQTNDFLISLDPSFGRYSISLEDVHLNQEFCGEEYGLFTEDGMHAVRTMKEKEDLHLDGTYTGKAAAAMLRDTQQYSKVETPTVILFWNTFCSQDCTDCFINNDYRLLPEAFHVFFEEEVQELDK